MPNTLYIVSYGLDPYCDMTSEVYSILKKSQKVYVLFDNPCLSKFLCENNIPYEDISFLYREGSLREDIYSTISDFIIDKALLSDITYLTYGDPMLLDSPIEKIIQKSKSLDLNIVLPPAISFLNKMLAQLRVSITNGFALYVATDLLKNRYSINKYMPCIISQIGVLNSKRANYSYPSIDDLTHFVEYLRTFYDADHSITVCDTDESGQKIISITVGLCVLPMISKGLTYNCRFASLDYK